MAPRRLAEAARAAGIADAREAPDVAAALRELDAPRRVLVCGSLYLAGAVLAENG
jgi:dihydrofolate synthase/folylpolyglutamate synthase